MSPAFLGNAGQAIIFVSLLAGTAIIGSAVLMYLAHTFLQVVQDTSAGNDTVDWPDEPITDWYWKVFYLAWLVAIWLAPPWLLLRYVGADLAAEHPALPAIVAAGALALLFPVGLLSSLSASSVWILVRPRVLREMSRHLPALAGFYASSGLLLAGCGVLVYAALFAEEWWLLPVAALATAAAVLIYARLLGRLAWILEPVQPKPAEPPPPPTAAPAPAPPTPKSEEPATPAPAGVNGYGFLDEDLPEQPRSYLGPGDDLEVRTRPRRLSKTEQARERRAQPLPPPPKWPLLSGIYTFPWYLTSLRTWIWLSVGCLIGGSLCRLLLMALPT